MKRCIILIMFCFFLTGCSTTLSSTYQSMMKEEMSNKPLEVYIMPYQCCVHQDAFWGPCRQEQCEDDDLAAVKGYFEKVKGYRDVRVVCAGQSDAKGSFSPKRAAEELFKQKAAGNNNSDGRFVLVAHFMKQYYGYDNYGGFTPVPNMLPICGYAIIEKFKIAGASQLRVGYELFDREKQSVVSSQQIKRQWRNVSWGKTVRWKVQEEIWLPEKRCSSSSWEFSESENEFIVRAFGKLFNDFPAAGN